MIEEFLTLQIKRIRRNIVFLAAFLISFGTFIAFNRGIGLMLGCIALLAFIIHPVSFINNVMNIKLISVNKAIDVYGRFYDVAQNI